MTPRFHSLNDVGWYGSAYLMTQLALQPTFGKLYTLFNIKLIYIAALLIFELGSTICAAAPTSTIFILERAICGAGSAGIWSGAFTIGTYLVPLRRKPLYISIVTSMYGVAAVAGPLLGGVFTDSKKADLAVLLLRKRNICCPQSPVPKKVKAAKHQRISTKSVTKTAVPYHLPR